MVWAMIMPNGLLSYNLLNRDFKSHAYIQLLGQTIVPIYKLNYGNNLWYLQDNSKFHTAKIVQKWMGEAKLQVLL